MNIYFGGFMLDNYISGFNRFTGLLLIIDEFQLKFNRFFSNSFVPTNHVAIYYEIVFDKKLQMQNMTIMFCINPQCQHCK